MPIRLLCNSIKHCEILKAAWKGMPVGVCLQFTAAILANFQIASGSCPFHKNMKNSKFMPRTACAAQHSRDHVNNHPFLFRSSFQLLQGMTELNHFLQWLSHASLESDLNDCQVHLSVVMGPSGVHDTNFEISSWSTGTLTAWLPWPLHRLKMALV